MSEKIIEVVNVSKTFNLYDKPIDRLKEALDPFKRQRHKKFHALKNLSFDIYKGDIIGLVGKNGAGKSTLLKIITGVLKENCGTVSVKGKIAALLELGAGFNMEYTGMENIYFNGSLMGCTKGEIDNKIDDIIKFADIGDFIEQPVKTYSSGMFARLAFAVAIHVDPDILIVDEALAVGDAAFAMKCMNRMRKIVEQGKTIIFVTHDIQTIRSFCNKAIWINNGELIKQGDASSITSEYTKWLFESNDSEAAVDKEIHDKDYIDEECDLEKFDEYTRWGNGKIKIFDVKLLNADKKECDMIEWGEDITIIVRAKVLKSMKDINTGIGISLRNKKAIDIITTTTIDESRSIDNLERGQIISAKFKFVNLLSPGEYNLIAAVEEREGQVPTYYDYIEDSIKFKVIGEGNFFSLIKQNVEQEIKVIE